MQRSKEVVMVVAGVIAGLLVVVAGVVLIVRWCETDRVAIFVVEGELRDLLVKRELTMLLVPIMHVAPVQPPAWFAPMPRPRGEQ